MCSAASHCRTCKACASASEYTATVRMPIRRAVAATRQAISPRLAMRMVVNMGARGWEKSVGRNLQSAQGSHHIKVGVAVQQHVAIRNAKTCEQHVNRAAYGVALRTQSAVVFGG